MSRSEAENRTDRIKQQSTFSSGFGGKDTHKNRISKFFFAFCNYFFVKIIIFESVYRYYIAI